MTVWLHGLRPYVYLIHPHKSVGLGLRQGIKGGTLFRRPDRIQ